MSNGEFNMLKTNANLFSSRGTPHPGMEYPPWSGQDWGHQRMGYPHPVIGYTPLWDGVPHRWGTPLDRTTEGVLAMWWAVCFLHSCRRTFLLALLLVIVSTTIRFCKSPRLKFSISCSFLKHLEHFEHLMLVPLQKLSLSSAENPGSAPLSPRKFLHSKQKDSGSKIV